MLSHELQFSRLFDKCHHFICIGNIGEKGMLGKMMQVLVRDILIFPILPSFLTLSKPAASGRSSGSVIVQSWTKSFNSLDQWSGLISEGRPLDAIKNTAYLKKYHQPIECSSMLLFNVRVKEDIPRKVDRLASFPRSRHPNSKYPPWHHMLVPWLLLEPKQYMCVLAQDNVVYIYGLHVPSNKVYQQWSFVLVVLCSIVHNDWNHLVSLCISMTWPH